MLRAFVASNRRRGLDQLDQQAEEDRGCTRIDGGRKREEASGDHEQRLWKLSASTAPQPRIKWRRGLFQPSTQATSLRTTPVSGWTDLSFLLASWVLWPRLTVGVKYCTGWFTNTTLQGMNVYIELSKKNWVFYMDIGVRVTDNWKICSKCREY